MLTFFTRKQIAEQLGVCSKTLVLHQHAGEFPEPLASGKAFSLYVTLHDYFHDHPNPQKAVGRWPETSSLTELADLVEQGDEAAVKTACRILRQLGRHQPMIGGGA